MLTKDVFNCESESILKSRLNDMLNSLVENKYAIIDDLFKTEVYESLQSIYFQSLPDFRPAQIGRGIDLNLNTEVRSDKILWIETSKYLHKDESEQTKPSIKDFGLDCFVNFNNLILMLIKKELFVPLKNFESHFAYYPQGSKYVRHVDRHKKSLARRFSSVYYLNDQWTKEMGGLLRLFTSANEHSSVEVEPVGNRWIIFLSDLEHEVLESRFDRKSIATWFRDVL